MRWIKQFLIFVVFASGLLARTSARTQSKLHPSVRFELCVARNLSRSAMFNEEEKERMDKIVLETSTQMRAMNADPENAVNTKTMLRLFAAALACVVADCESSIRPQREQACITALEACAESLKERAGVEVVEETKRIFAAMRREITILEEIADNASTTEAKKPVKSDKKTETAKRDDKKVSSEEEASVVKERPKRAYVSTFQYQDSRVPLQSNPTLESIITDKLLKSATFRDFFSFGLSQEDAIFYSRSMVLSGLNGYRYDVIQEAMNAVSAALSRLGSFAGPNDYADRIARAIAAVLAAHELTFFADGLNIGGSLVYQLDSMLGSNPSSTFALSPSFGSAAVSSFGSFDSAASASSSGWGSSGALASSQSSGMASVQLNPSFVESSFAVPPNPQNDKTQFQHRLSYFLSQSPTISGAFCSGPVPGIYEVMNSAFSDYGYSIASTIANVVSNSLNMLPVDAACAQYQEVISEVVADILNNNGYILTADPQIITNRISDLINASIESNPPQNPSSFGQQPFSGSDYPLNPSFSDYSDSAPEAPVFSADQASDSTIPRSDADIPIQQQNPVQANSTEFSSEVSPLVIQSSSKQDLPAESSFAGLAVPDGSPLSSDGTVEANNSWVVVDYPTGAVSGLDQMNQTSGSIGIVAPVILEPGPVIPVNIPSDTESVLKTEVSSANNTRAEPEIIAVTKAPEATTPVPLSTNFQSSSAMPNLEVTTPAPQAALKEAFEDPSKLSKFLLEEMKSSLKALNATMENKKNPVSLLETSGNSTGVVTLQSTDSTPIFETSKPTEKSPVSQTNPSMTKTDVEVKPTLEASTQQNRPPQEVPLTKPKPIADELTALVFADKVSAIVSRSIGLIRSQNFQFEELCRSLNELAPMVDLPPLDVCEEIPMIDYLMHVLNAVTYSLAGEK